jgi:hypothetical protein
VAFGEELAGLIAMAQKRGRDKEMSTNISSSLGFEGAVSYGVLVMREDKAWIRDLCLIVMGGDTYLIFAHRIDDDFWWLHTPRRGDFAAGSRCPIWQ